MLTFYSYRVPNLFLFNFLWYKWLYSVRLELFPFLELWVLFTILVIRKRKNFNQKLLLHLQQDKKWSAECEGAVLYKGLNGDEAFITVLTLDKACNKIIRTILMLERDTWTVFLYITISKALLFLQELIQTLTKTWFLKIWAGHSIMGVLIKNANCWTQVGWESASQVPRLFSRTLTFESHRCQSFAQFTVLWSQ